MKIVFRTFLLIATLAFISFPALAQDSEAPLPDNDSAGDREVWEEKEKNSEFSEEDEEGVEGGDYVRDEEINQMLDDLFGDITPEDEKEMKKAAPLVKEIKKPEAGEKENTHKTQILPSTIYKKQYSVQNSHLPKARTIDDFDRYVFSAAAADNINGLRALLNMGRSPNLQNRDGNTPLMASAFSDSINTARLLLIKGAEVNIQNDLGLTALHIAVHRGSNKVLKTLLNAGADVNIQDKNGNTSLIAASVSGNLNAARALTDAGAEVDTQNNVGLTALHVAAYKGRTTIAQILLATDADPAIEDKNGATAEEMAVAGRHSVTVRALQGAGPRREAKLSSEFILDKLAGEDEKEPDWYISPSEKVRYDLLPLSEQIKWDELLASWVKADEKFESLSEEEKQDWNEKRKILQMVFSEYFIADTVEDQMALDEYMERWEDLGISEEERIIREEIKIKSAAEEEAVDEEKERMLNELEAIESQIPTTEDYQQLEKEYNEKFSADDKAPEELPEEITDESLAEELEETEETIEEPSVAPAIDEQPAPAENVDEGLWEDDTEFDDLDLPEVQW